MIDIERLKRDRKAKQDEIREIREAVGGELMLEAIQILHDQAKYNPIIVVIHNTYEAAQRWREHTIELARFYDIEVTRKDFFVMTHEDAKNITYNSRWFPFYLGEAQHP